MTEPMTVTVVLPPEVFEAVAHRAAEIVEARSGNHACPVSPWLYGAKAAAEYLGQPVGRIERLQANGRIPCHRVGERRYAYHCDELDRWITDGPP